MTESRESHSETSTVVNSPNVDSFKSSSDSSDSPFANSSISTITIPRWIVYFQAALLGLIATTFFIFGLMVGTLTSNQNQVVEQTFDCQVTGTVEYQSRDGDEFVADAGAVVFLLPKDRRPEERSAGSLVSPDSFEPLDNPGIDIVNRLGGAIVRTDKDGNYNLTVDGSKTGIEYFVLIVSKNATRKGNSAMTKQQVAAIGTFFMPVERVVNEHAYYGTSLTARDAKSELATVRF